MRSQNNQAQVGLSGRGVQRVEANNDDVAVTAVYERPLLVVLSIRVQAQVALSGRGVQRIEANNDAIVVTAVAGP